MLSSSEYLFIGIGHKQCTNQEFTKSACSQTNGKAERMILTLMEMWHNQQVFSDVKNIKQKLKRFINFYNTVKPDKAILEKTPYEFLEDYFNHEV